MKKMIIRSQPRPVRQSNTRSSFYNSTIAITYGTIDSNNTDGTTNVLLITGFITRNIRIPSSFYPSKDPTIGGITYPPINSEVIILHPLNDINSGWIRPAPLDENDDQVISDLLSGGDKSILPGGWTITYDQTTGNLIATNSGSAVLEINGSIPVARQDDPVKSTITEDSDFWGWAVKYNTFNTAWKAALATLQASGGTPAGVVAYATAMQTLLTTLGTIPAELTGKIIAGSDKIKVG